MVCWCQIRNKITTDVWLQQNHFFGSPHYDSVEYSSTVPVVVTHCCSALFILLAWYRCSPGASFLKEVVSCVSCYILPIICGAIHTSRFRYFFCNFNGFNWWFDMIWERKSVNYFLPTLKPFGNFDWRITLNQQISLCTYLKKRNH